MSMRAPRRCVGWLRPGTEDGFTLVEVLVAAALFATVFLALATLFARATTDLAGSRLLTATTVAQTAMEEALNARLLSSRTWTVDANRIQWEISRSVEEVRNDLWTIRIVVRRPADGRVYATLWTQVLRPSR